MASLHYLGTVPHTKVWVKSPASAETNFLESCLLRTLLDVHSEAWYPERRPLYIPIGQSLSPLNNGDYESFIA